MQMFEQIRNTIKPLRVVVQLMKERKLPVEQFEDIRLTVSEINGVLYHTEKLKFQKEYNLENENEYLAYIGETEGMIQIWTQSLERRKGNKVDVKFWEIYEYFKYVSEEVIYQSVINQFMSLPEGQRIEYLSLPRRYTFLTNKIDVTKCDFSLIRQHIELMCRKVEKYKWLYMKLEDYRSKAVLNGIISYWFEFDINKLHQMCETLFADYFDLDIVKCDENDVMVDLGAFTGDSTLDYIATYGQYKKIYAYEITPSTYQVLANNVSEYPDVIPVNKGVGDSHGVMYVDGVENGAGNKLSTSGEVAVEVVALDEDITEPISVIKMDIEGAEKSAIIGATEHIKNDRPKLLVSSYHLPDDIFDIPELIHDIRDDYKFYMRFNGHGGIWPCDYVLFAV